MIFGILTFTFLDATCLRDQWMDASPVRIYDCVNNTDTFYSIHFYSAFSIMKDQMTLLFRNQINRVNSQKKQAKFANSFRKLVIP